MINLFSTLTLCAALGCGVMAGLLFTFSAFLMTALGRLPVVQGITTMQTINVAILNPAFGLVFFGTMLVCLVLAVTFPFTAQQPGAVWRLVGAILFLAGVGLVTVLFNVPLNDELAKVDPASLEGAMLWEHYRAAWTGWNHLRTDAHSCRRGPQLYSGCSKLKRRLVRKPGARKDLATQKEP